MEGGGKRKEEGGGTERERENTRGLALGFSKRGKDEERNAFVSMRSWEIQKRRDGREDTSK